MKTIKLTKPGRYTYTLSHEGEELNIVGSFSLSHHDQFDLDLTIIHLAPHTTANTVLKAVVDDEAQANLIGKIIVQKNAFGTNSFLKENVLLLSPKAKASAIPNLEILCNDVKCSHAATIGKIDPDQVFYLMSRGLPEPEAKSAIAQGFLL